MVSLRGSGGSGDEDGAQLDSGTQCLPRDVPVGLLAAGC